MQLLAGINGRNAERKGALAQLALPAMLVMAFALQVELAFAKSINWDEFFHFSQIHRQLQDRPMQWLQLPFVWLFFWVPALPGDNISHIQLIRLLILTFEVAGVFAIMACVRKFYGRNEALLCGLLFVTGGYVFLHAFALRADMIAASLLSVALWIGLCRPARQLEFVLIVVLVGLAFVSTIKTILYAPAFLGVALYRTQKRSWQWVIAAGAAASLSAGVLLLWIAPELPDEGVASVLRDIGLLGQDAIGRMFSAGMFPQPEWLKGQIVRAPLLFLAVCITILLCMSKNRGTRERLLVLFLLLPLCSVAFYRNAYPYFFVFILPPVAIAAAPAIGFLLRRYGAIPLGLCMLATGFLLSANQDRDVLGRQRTVLAGIHEIFPSPVTYVDDCGIVGDFPRAINRYASGWALANYRAKGQPTYAPAIAAEPVPMLLADHGRVGTICFDILHRRVLLPPDARALRNNYVQHWGNVFVAGKQIEPGTEDSGLEIVIPGRYTVEGGSITIDGSTYTEGSVLELAKGNHVVAGGRPEALTLRWGSHLHRPPFPWPQGRLFTDF